MDVALLSRMIKELMLDRDSLSLPGLGTFGVDYMPASFSDKGYTINPPYRRLTFSQQETSDGLLQELYAGSNGISSAEAEGILRSFSEGLAQDLKSSRSVDFPGLGRLRSTREGHIFFVPAPDLDISPDACGLTSVSLKTHTSVFPEISTDTISPEKAITNDPVADSGVTEAESASGNCGRPWPNEWEGRSEAEASGDRFCEVKPESAANGQECAENLSEASKKEANGQKNAKKVSGRKRSRAAMWAIGAAAAVAIVLGGFAALARLAPDFTDRLLYTPEQLAIINTPEDGPHLPS